MSSQNTFAKDFAAKLSGKISNEDLNLVLSELEIYTDNFDINRKVRELSVRVDFTPSFYETFFACKALKGMSNSSIKMYKYHLDKFFGEVCSPIDLITTNTIRKYLAIMLKRGGKRTYIDMSRRVLNSFFGWSFKEGYIEFNPMDGIENIKCASEPRKPLTGVEMEMLRDGCISNNKAWGKKTELRDKALIEVLYATGARVSEIHTLDISDIDFVTREVHLFGKGSKYRTSYLNDKALYRLQLYLESRKDDNPALFVSAKNPHTRMTKEGIEQALRRISKRTEIGRSVYPHLLRHTFATDALSHGADITTVQALLGHEEPRTTLIYAHILQDNVRSEYQKYVS